MGEVVRGDQTLELFFKAGYIYAWNGTWDARKREVRIYLSLTIS